MPDEPDPPAPRRLYDVTAPVPPAGAGAVWRLAEPGRQLDANLVHLPPGEHIGTHTEPDLDVLLLAVAGGGTIEVPPTGETQPVSAGTLHWLPHGSTRAVTAGPDGLSYLTVHRRRPGLRIRSTPPPGSPLRPKEDT